jgi:hypothetical protein
MGDGAVLTLASNLGSEAVPFKAPSGTLLFASTDTVRDMLAGYCTCAWLDADQVDDE